MVSRQEEQAETKDQDKEQEGNTRQGQIVKNIIEIILIFHESGEGDSVPKGPRVLSAEEKRLTCAAVSLSTMAVTFEIKV